MCDSGTCFGCRYTSHAGVWTGTAGDSKPVKPASVDLSGERAFGLNFEHEKFRIVEAENGSLPTIVDSSGRSVLKLDTRTVDGNTYVTPVFESHDLAERVLKMLNGE